MCLHSSTECAYDTFQAYDLNAPKKRRKRKPDEPRQSDQISVFQAIDVINNPQVSSSTGAAAAAAVPPPPKLAAVQSMLTRAIPNPYGGPKLLTQDAHWNQYHGGITVIDDEDDQYTTGEIVPFDHQDYQLATRADSFSSDSSTPSGGGPAGSVTVVSRAYSASPRFQLDFFHDSSTSSPFKYLWAYYMESTARFCAIHDFETPFLSSIVPLAANNDALQSSLMFLSTVYRNKILGLNDDNHERVANELSVRSMSSLRDKLNFNLRPDEALVGIATCLGLTCCYIGINSSSHYNTHLYGGLMIATTVLIPDKRFVINHDAWFLFKWLTYCTVLVNINLLPVPSDLAQAKAHNLPAMEKLYTWWQVHAHEDPEYDLPVDSFYGFGTRLAPLILQFNILAGRQALLGMPGFEYVQPVMQQEIDDLERSLWQAHECSTMAIHTAVCLRQTDFDLLHCDVSFHCAALLYLYTYLKTDHFSATQRIPYLVQSVIAEVKAISPVCRTAAALLFVMYVTGSCADLPDERSFIYNHLSGMRETCLSSVDSVLAALRLVWDERDRDGRSVPEAHAKVREAGINVCVY